MSTARCYTCHTLRPVHAFPYRRKDNIISTSARLKRFLCVLLQKPGATTSDTPRNGGIIYSYRCIHPLDGPCPKDTREMRRRPVELMEVEVRNEAPTLRVGQLRRRHSGHLGHEVEVSNVITRQTLDTKMQIPQAIANPEEIKMLAEQVVVEPDRVRV